MEAADQQTPPKKVKMKSVTPLPGSQADTTLGGIPKDVWGVICSKICEVSSSRNILSVNKSLLTIAKDNIDWRGVYAQKFKEKLEFLASPNPSVPFVHRSFVGKSCWYNRLVHRSKLGEPEVNCNLNVWRNIEAVANIELPSDGDVSCYIGRTGIPLFIHDTEEGEMGEIFYQVGVFNFETKQFDNYIVVYDDRSSEIGTKVLALSFTVMRLLQGFKYNAYTEDSNQLRKYIEDYVENVLDDEAYPEDDFKYVYGKGKPYHFKLYDNDDDYATGKECIPDTKFSSFKKVGNYIAHKDIIDVFDYWDNESTFTRCFDDPKDVTDPEVFKFKPTLKEIIILKEEGDLISVLDDPKEVQAIVQENIKEGGIDHICESLSKKSMALFRAFRKGGNLDNDELFDEFPELAESFTYSVITRWDGIHIPPLEENISDENKHLKSIQDD